MAFLRVSVAPSKDRRLYCMRIISDGKTYYKFGVASGHSAKERLLQIVASHFDKYRETPVIKIMRDQKVDSELVFKLESILHNFFAFYRFNNHVHRAFDGSTECFLIDKNQAIQAYDAVMDGLVPDFTYYKEEDQIPF